jgi:hypothetical protein
LIQGKKGMSENEKDNRERAYQYLVYLSNASILPSKKFSHKKLADRLSLSDKERLSIEIALNRLRDGLEDPSPLLVNTLKAFLGPTIPGEFDSRLVTPFLDDK